MAINQEFCLLRFAYSNGVLYWNPWHEGFKNNQAKLAWNTKYANKPVGSNDGQGYKRVRLSDFKKSFGVHALIYLMHHNVLPEEVDHINGIVGDNRVENLRSSNKTTNKYNTRISKANTSGIKGVSIHKRTGKIRCSLSSKNKVRQVYGFSSFEDADEFMQLWRNMAHGDFANHGKNISPWATQE
jgi:hypothetical protein